MKVIGILLMILGGLTIIVGGLGLGFYYVYDLVMNWETLTRNEIFWHIVWFILRDVVAIGVGFILFVIGGAMVGKFDNRI